MNFWWVNQNQTFEQETNCGYLWSHAEISIAKEPLTN